MSTSQPYHQLPGLMPPRRTKQTDVFSLLLCGVGTLFFALAVFNLNGQSDVPYVNPEIYEVDHTPFSIESLAASHYYLFEENIANGDKEDPIFLYIMTPELCEVCLNEVTGFVNLLEDKGFAGRSVQNIILVLSKDLREAERFWRVSNFPTVVGFGYDAELAPILERFRSGTMSRQIVMIDPKTDTIFFRHLLKTGEMSDDELKHSVLKLASEAFSTLR